jgi:hypothetical protein
MSIWRWASAIAASRSALSASWTASPFRAAVSSEASPTRSIPDRAQRGGADALRAHHRVGEQDPQPHLAPVALAARLDLLEQLDAAAVVSGGLGKRRRARGSAAGVLVELRRAQQLAAVGEVVPEQLRLAAHVLGEALLEHRGHQPVQLDAAAAQQRLVGGVANQRVAELESRPLDRRAALEDAGADQPLDGAVERVRGDVDDRREQPRGEAAPENGSHLRDIAGGPEPVEPGQQRALQRGGQARALRLAGRRHQLLDEQRDAVGAIGHLVDHVRVEPAGGAEPARERPRVLGVEPVEGDVHVDPELL